VPSVSPPVIVVQAPSTSPPDVPAHLERIRADFEAAVKLLRSNARDFKAIREQLEGD
jgi:hypothetical protein